MDWWVIRLLQNKTGSHGDAMLAARESQADASISRC